MFRRHVVAALIVVLLGGCTQTISLKMPDNTIQVRIRDGRVYDLSPASENFRRLSRWIDRNHSGWSSYVGTLPMSAVAVNLGTCYLGFSGSSVIAIFPHSYFTKRIDPIDYQYLLQEL